MSKTNIMVDLETWGKSPDGVIASLGAVKFNINGVFSSFYDRVNPQSCIDIGMSLNMSTIIWWMGQSEEARAEMQKEGTPIVDVLNGFAHWAHRNGDSIAIWGNGATFDNVILSSAYDATKIERPWGYTDDRCYRTIKNLYPDVKLERVGTAHNALDDALSQANHLITIARKHNISLN